MECYCYLRNINKISCLIGRHLKRGDSEKEPFKGPIIPFGAMAEYHPISAKDLSRLHQFGKKVLSGQFLGYASYAGGHLERRHFGRRHRGHGKDGRI